MENEQLKKQAAAAAEELIAAAGVPAGGILVVGCSTSEVCGSRIGTDSSPEAAKALFEGIYGVCRAHGLYLAAQCCEHLNRAIIIERDAVPSAEIVNVRPVPKAGGSFATAAFGGFEHPVAVEEIRADAGLDIGDTFIGMHLKRVAVPVRLKNSVIGQAHVTAARTRPKYIGGARAQYNEE